MKTVLISLLLIVSGLLFYSPSASAANVFSNTCGAGQIDNGTVVCNTVNPQNANNGLNNDPILINLKKVIELLSYIIGVSAVIVIIIAGIQFVVGGSNSQSLANSRNMIIFALVGIFVALLAQTIVVFVLNKVA